jgi:hypothetical protein
VRRARPAPRRAEVDSRRRREQSGGRGAAILVVGVDRL